MAHIIDNVCFPFHETQFSTDILTDFVALAETICRRHQNSNNPEHPPIVVGQCRLSFSIDESIARSSLHTSSGNQIEAS